MSNYTWQTKQLSLYCALTPKFGVACWRVNLLTCKESGIIIYNRMEFVSVFCKNELLHYFVSASTSNYLGIVSNYRRYRKRNNCARLVLINIHFCKKKKSEKKKKRKWDSGSKLTLTTRSEILNEVLHFHKYL